MALDSNLFGFNKGNIFSDNLKNSYSIISKHIQYRDLASVYRKIGSLEQNSSFEKEGFVNKIIQSLQNDQLFYAGIMLDDTFDKGQKGYISTPNLDMFDATDVILLLL